MINDTNRDKSLAVSLLKLTRGGVEWEKVMDHLIETAPSLVIQAIHAISADPYLQVRAMARNGEGKVPCIKLYRDLSKSGLKEAKDWVEEHCIEFKNHPTTIVRGGRT
jgi:hypothetical protein